MCLKWGHNEMRLQDKYLFLKKRLIESDFSIGAENVHYSWWASVGSLLIMTLLVGFNKQLGMIFGAVAGCIVSIGIGQLLSSSTKKGTYVLSAIEQSNKQDLETYVFNYVNRMSTTSSDIHKLDKGYACLLNNDGKEVILLDSESGQYVLQNDVIEEKISIEIFRFMLNEYKEIERINATLSFVEKIQLLINGWGKMSDNRDIEWYRLSRIVLDSGLLGQLKELESECEWNEWDVVELLSYLYIQTDVKETFVMQDRLTTFVSERKLVSDSHKVALNEIREGNVHIASKNEQELNSGLLSLNSDTVYQERVELFKEKNVLNDFIVSHIGKKEEVK